MKAYERLLNYVKVPTPSNEKSGTHPSSECQRVLADQLAEEMKALGVSDVRVEDKCYVYGKIPATKGYEGKTKLGFIAHMDTVSDFADHAVNPIVHENYDGKDLKLADSGRTLEVSIPGRQNADHKRWNNGARCRRQGGRGRDYDTGRSPSCRRNPARSDFHRIYTG